MPFYTGSTPDGSDAKEVTGAYVNEEGTEWSSTPYPHQKKEVNIRNELISYMDGKFTLKDVHLQIQLKTCPLPKRVRDYVIKIIEHDLIRN